MSLHFAGYDWSAGSTKQVVYHGGPPGHIQELFVGVGGPWNFADLTAITGAPPMIGADLSGYAWSAGSTKQVVYPDANGHIQELFVGVGGQWNFADLTAITGAPTYQGGRIEGYAWSAGGTKQVISIIISNNHIQELYVGAGAPWQAADLMVITGAPQV